MNHEQANRTHDSAPAVDLTADDIEFLLAIKDKDRRQEIISILESAGLLPL